RRPHPRIAPEDRQNRRRISALRRQGRRPVFFPVPGMGATNVAGVAVPCSKERRARRAGRGQPLSGRGWGRSSVRVSNRGPDARLTARINSDIELKEAGEIRFMVPPAYGMPWQLGIGIPNAMKRIRVYCLSFEFATLIATLASR